MILEMLRASDLLDHNDDMHFGKITAIKRLNFEKITTMSIKIMDLKIELSVVLNGIESCLIAASCRRLENLLKRHVNLEDETKRDWMLESETRGKAKWSVSL